MAEALKRTFYRGTVPSIALWGILFAGAVGGGIGIFSASSKLSTAQKNTTKKFWLGLIGFLLLFFGGLITGGGLLFQISERMKMSKARRANAL